MMARKAESKGASSRPRDPILEAVGFAAEQFLTKSPVEREGLIRLVMEGHLRGIMGQLTVEQIVKEPDWWPSSCVPLAPTI